MICILCLMLHLSRFTRDSLLVSALTRRLGRQVDDTNPRIDMFLRRYCARYSSFVALIIIE